MQTHTDSKGGGGKLQGSGQKKEEGTTIQTHTHTHTRQFNIIKGVEGVEEEKCQCVCVCIGLDWEVVVVKEGGKGDRKERR